MDIFRAFCELRKNSTEVFHIQGSNQALVATRREHITVATANSVWDFILTNEKLVQTEQKVKKDYWYLRLNFDGSQLVSNKS